MLNAGVSSFYLVQKGIHVGLRQQYSCFRALPDGEARIQNKFDDPIIRLRVSSCGSTFSRKKYLFTSLISAAERVQVIFMYRHLILVPITLLGLFFHPLTTIALAIAPQGNAITALNRTQGESTLNLTLSEGLLNESLTPLQNFISYRVPHSPTTLLFHSFGTPIPIDELLQSITLAVGVIIKTIGEGRGRTPFATGFFSYTHEFLNHDEVEIIVGDFRETGRPMTNYALFDVIRGVGEFMIMPGQKTRVLQFEAEVQGLGYVGTGHVDYTPCQTSTPGLA
ncbi:MAG: hypothetical protein Q9175_007836 [Cornicularia normoerica]